MISSESHSKGRFLLFSSVIKLVQPHQHTGFFFFLKKNNKKTTTTTYSFNESILVNISKFEQRIDLNVKRFINKSVTIVKT